MICWLLAFVFGVFIAAALIGWGGANGLLGAVIGLIAMLIVGWLLKGIFCGDEVSSPSVTTSAAVAPAATKVEAPEVKAVPKKAAPKKATKKSVAKKAAPKKATAKKATAKKAPTKYYQKPPAKIDDLKLISGVGPKLEATLNKIGIYQYAQVAVWKKADIKEVDAQLTFKGRIERDDWMAQAKILAKGGDTEFSKKKRK
jgi:predicted flap endonuclease-1-like 5' DNA nuclease